MNKEFRVWDDRLNIFNYFDLNSIDGRLPVDCINNVQQYTGLKDQNGKKIFEGDIIRILVKDEKGCSFDTKGEVRYEEFEYVVFTDCDNWPCVSFAVIDLRYGKVIGNIFENPELL